MDMALITGSRSDWPLVEPILRAATEAPEVSPRLLVTGAHLSERHGSTLGAIEAAGWTVSRAVPILGDRADDSSEAVAHATGRAVSGLSAALSSLGPTWVVVVGDRYESFAGALAASMLGLPVAHVGGGETDIATNQDGNLRNALTKLAQVHFVANETGRERVLALGEEPERVHVVGLPSLDGIRWGSISSRGELAGATGLRGERGFLLVSYLPVTLDPARSLADLDALLAGLDDIDEYDKLLILGNADACADAHDRRVQAWASGRSDTRLVRSLEVSLYRAAMRYCECYVGNSSSGVIEAPLLGTPSVIVGLRQLGRETGARTTVVSHPTRAEVIAAVRRECQLGRYEGGASPYGDGQAAVAICRVLRSALVTPRLLEKRLIVPGRAACDMSV